MPMCTVALLTSRKSTPIKLLSMITIIVLLLETASGLRLHQQQDPKQYNKQTYYSQLEGIQQRFSNDLNSIKDQFTKINLKLADTNISASDKVIYLQENLANERDSLYNVENYLNVPFALRSCQCVNVTQEEKDTLGQQINSVQKSISDLQRALKTDKNGNIYQNPKCPNGNCAAYVQINKQIDQMNSYVKIMNDTITSECCKIINYVYRDNLIGDSQWVYGTTNQNQYRLFIFNLSKEQNVTLCRTDKPFANLTTNLCFSCPSDQPLFNLGTRKCQTNCKNRSLIYKTPEHVCDYNRTCQVGGVFNNITHQCDIDLGNSSVCPKEKPIWNETLLACAKCQPQKPFFDTVVRACRKCTQNEVWQSYTQICLDKALILMNCPNGSYYKQQTKNCEKIPIPNPNITSPDNQTTSTSTPTPQANNTSVNVKKQPNAGTYSQCPPATPFWSQTDLTCTKCSDVTPFFNSTSKQCEKCPENTSWVSSLSTCVKISEQCPEGQIFNKETQKCQAKITCLSNQVYNPTSGQCDTIGSSGQIGMCPPETPFWNSKNLLCEKCSVQLPYWNATVKQCQNCPVNTKWDPNHSKCKSTITTCQQGETLNPETNTCISTKCPSDSPIFNFKINKCEPCPTGTTFNTTTNICDSKSSEKTSASACPSTAPYWNPQKLSCDKCPVDQIYDSASSTCKQPPPAHFKSFPSSAQHLLNLHTTFIGRVKQ